MLCRIDQRERELHHLFHGYLSNIDSLNEKQQFINFADDFIGTYEKPMASTLPPHTSTALAFL